MSNKFQELKNLRKSGNSFNPTSLEINAENSIEKEKIGYLNNTGDKFNDLEDNHNKMENDYNTNKNDYTHDLEEKAPIGYINHIPNEFQNFNSNMIYL